MATLSERPRSSASWHLLPAPEEPESIPQLERIPTPQEFEQPGVVSGLISTGFGLVQLLAPKAFLRMVGMPYPPWLIRAVGARDLALGIGLLAQPASMSWRTTRFVNDVLDTGLIGAAAFSQTSRRGRLAVFAALAGCVIVFDALAAGAGRRAAAPDANRFDI